MEMIDISALMKQATKIRREQGYPEAVEFLKKLIDRCLRLTLSEIGGEPNYFDENKSYYLSQSLNKIRSYMESVKTISNDEIADYLKSIIEQLPSNYAFFDAHILYVNYLLKLKKTEDAMRALQVTQLLLNPYMPRHDYLRKQGIFHNCMIEISSQTKSKSARLDYLYHSFIFYCIEVALVYDIGLKYSEASDNYYWTFEKLSTMDISESRCLEMFDNDEFDKCLQVFGSYDKKKELINEYCQFYSKGLYEALNKRFWSQLDRYKKLLSEMEFRNYTGLPQIDDEIYIIETGIHTILKKYIKEML